MEKSYFLNIFDRFFFFICFFFFFTFSSFIFAKASVFLDDFDSKKKSYEKHNKACHQEVQSNDGDLMKHQNNW